MVHMSMLSLIPEATRRQKLASAHRKNIQADEPARIGYASIYGELPKLELKKEVSDVPFIPSERPWETVFAGSYHVLLLSRNYVPLSWHLCWRRDQSQTSEKHWNFIPSYIGMPCCTQGKMNIKKTCSWWR